MVVSCEEMRRAEEAAFAGGTKAGDLMAEAGLGIAVLVRQFHSRPGTCVAVCGKGNNAGDALVAARHLREWGWKIFVHLADEILAFSELPARHFQSLEAEAFDPENISFGRPLLVLDGLLGIGAKGEPRDRIADAIGLINRLRRERGAWVLAIDIPSGLDGDTGIPSKVCVEADVTAAISGVKAGLVADRAANSVGRLAVVPLGGLEPGGVDKATTASLLRSYFPPRHFDTHKGVAGRVGIIAGSPGFLGAARMCSSAAVHGGAGLVTLYARPEIASHLSLACVPEIMVKTVASYRDVLSENLDALAVGPGLGMTHASEILSIIRDAPLPMVVDADALTILSGEHSLLKRCQGPRLLTPHPGEMQRLFPADGRTRRQWAQAFLTQYPAATLLLKGSRTIVGRAGEFLYNTTGNPGMASGGMGDVLTGVCAALIAQLENSAAAKDASADMLFRSAALGAWICGRAAEHAIFRHAASPESLSATMVISCLGEAFRSLREET